MAATQLDQRVQKILSWLRHALPVQFGASPAKSEPRPAFFSRRVRALLSRAEVGAASGEAEQDRGVAQDAQDPIDGGHPSALRQGTVSSHVAWRVLSFNHSKCCGCLHQNLGKCKNMWLQASAFNRCPILMLSEGVKLDMKILSHCGPRTILSWNYTRLDTGEQEMFEKTIFSQQTPCGTTQVPPTTDFQTDSTYCSSNRWHQGVRTLDSMVSLAAPMAAPLQSACKSSYRNPTATLSGEKA